MKYELARIDLSSYSRAMEAMCSFCPAILGGIVLVSANLPDLPTEVKAIGYLAGTAAEFLAAEMFVESVFEVSPARTIYQNTRNLFKS